MRECGQQSQGSICGTCGGKVAVGWVYFPFLIYHPATAPSQCSFMHRGNYTANSTSLSHLSSCHCSFPMLIYVPWKLYCLAKLSSANCKHVQYTALLPLTSKTTTNARLYVSLSSSSVGSWRCVITHSQPFVLGSRPKLRSGSLYQQNQ